MYDNVARTADAARLDHLVAPDAEDAALEYDFRTQHLCCLSRHTSSLCLK
jgi:hypothetical protein